MLARLTIVHPLVDACSLCVLLAGGMTWERVLAYNFLAFALQLPLGVALDAWPGLRRAAASPSGAGSCARRRVRRRPARTDGLSLRWRASATRFST